MSVEHSLSESETGSAPAQSRAHRGESASPVIDASVSPVQTAGDGNGRAESASETGAPMPEAGLSSHPVGESPAVEVSDDVRKWVKEQIPNKKTGRRILSLAKNRKRKDVEEIARHVDDLVAAGEIPWSGEKAPAIKTDIAALGSPFPNSRPTLPAEPKEAVEVPIADIRMNAQIRRESLIEANVLRIMDNFDCSDPVDLFKRPEGELELANGHHRAEAAKRLGRTTIKAYIHEGTMCDALIFAYKTNDRNGMPLTKADRMKALVMIKATPEGGKLTSDQLANQLGVSRQTIQTYLSEIRSGKSADTRTRVPPDKAALREKAVGALVRIEGRFGLAVFRDFVGRLGDDKRAELRAMLDGAGE